MQRDELIKYIEASKIFDHWHWFRYHFAIAIRGASHPLADSVIQACLDCDEHIDGYSRQVVDRLAAIGGREKELSDWEQLIQILAELLVVRHILKWDWPEEATFESEPTAVGSQKNPELIIKLNELSIGMKQVSYGQS